MSERPARGLGMGLSGLLGEGLRPAPGQAQASRGGGGGTPHPPLFGGSSRGSSPFGGIPAFWGRLGGPWTDYLTRYTR